jgi:hypothetical protein
VLLLHAALLLLLPQPGLLQQVKPQPAAAAALSRTLGILG